MSLCQNFSHIDCSTSTAIGNWYLKKYNIFLIWKRLVLLYPSRWNLERKRIKKLVLTITKFHQSSQYTNFSLLITFNNGRGVKSTTTENKNQTYRYLGSYCKQWHRCEECDSALVSSAGYKTKYPSFVPI